MMGALPSTTPLQSFGTASGFVTGVALVSAIVLVADYLLYWRARRETLFSAVWKSLPLVPSVQTPYGITTQLYDSIDLPDDTPHRSDPAEQLHQLNELSRDGDVTAAGTEASEAESILGNIYAKLPDSDPNADLDTMYRDLSARVDTTERTPAETRSDARSLIQRLTDTLPDEPNPGEGDSQIEHLSQLLDEGYRLQPSSEVVDLTPVFTSVRETVTESGSTRELESESARRFLSLAEQYAKGGTERRDIIESALVDVIENLEERQSIIDELRTKALSQERIPPTEVDEFSSDGDLTRVLVQFGRIFEVERNRRLDQRSRLEELEQLEEQTRGLARELPVKKLRAEVESDTDDVFELITTAARENVVGVRTASLVAQRYREDTDGQVSESTAARALIDALADGRASEIDSVLQETVEELDEFTRYREEIDDVAPVEINDRGISLQEDLGTVDLEIVPELLHDHVGRIKDSAITKESTPLDRYIASEHLDWFEALVDELRDVELGVAHRDVESVIEEYQTTRADVEQRFDPSEPHGITEGHQLMRPFYNLGTDLGEEGIATARNGQRTAGKATIQAATRILAKVDWAYGNDQLRHKLAGI